MTLVPVPQEKKGRGRTQKDMEKEKEKERQRIATIEAEMKAPLQAELKKIRNFIENRIGRNLRDAWVLGRKVCNIHDSEHKYGANAVGRLAACIVYDKSVLHKSMRFYRLFDQASLEELLKLRMKTSKARLTWSHVEKLMVSELEQNPKLRGQLIKDTVENDWSSDELAYWVRVRTEAKDKIGQRRGGGRPAVVPKNLVLRAQNLEKVTGMVVRNDELFYRHPQYNFVVSVQDMPADKITPQVIKYLEDGLGNIDKLLERLPMIKQNLAEAKELAEVKMKQQAQKEGVIDANVIDAKEVKQIESHPTPAKMVESDEDEDDVDDDDLDDDDIDDQDDEDEDDEDEDQDQDQNPKFLGVK